MLTEAFESTDLPLISSASCVISQLDGPASATVSPRLSISKSEGRASKHQNRKTQKNKEEKERREEERGRGLSQLSPGGVSSDSSFWLYSQFFR